MRHVMILAMFVALAAFAARPGGPIYDVRIWAEMATLPTDVLARAEAEVLRELERLGMPAVPRVPPGDPDLWWASALGSG